MQKACHEALETVGRHYRDDPILKVALELEHIALSDDYFIENKLGPNIDFYSAITLKALGFPTDMLQWSMPSPALRAGSRNGRDVDDPSQRIGRPRQLYTGATERAYVPMELRS